MVYDEFTWDATVEKSNYKSLLSCPRMIGCNETIYLFAAIYDLPIEDLNVWSLGEVLDVMLLESSEMS